MGHTRRQFKSGTLYEISFRAKEGLPFVAYRVIELIIESVVARVQRDNKVTLSHDVWEGSHCHLIAIAWDSSNFVAFYGELKKQLTDGIKALLGKEYLNLWEDYPTVAEIVDLPTAIERISYLYANPAQDNLVDSIEKFPGTSSYKDFRQCCDDITAVTTKQCPWIQRPMIEPLHSCVLTPDQDSNITKKLIAKSKKKHAFIRKPNAWMKCFGVTSSEEAKHINESILCGIRAKEEVARRTKAPLYPFSALLTEDSCSA